ncbi:MAG: flagellar motor switch protein FliG, partial [Limisphaerales bacterium]
MPEATAELSRTQRLAAFLVIIGEESASEIMRHLDSKELEIVAGEMAILPMMSRAQQEEIMKEFSELALTASTAV